MQDREGRFIAGRAGRDVGDHVARGGKGIGLRAQLGEA